MIDWRQRSTAPEYMDDASAVGDDVLAALTEIAYVNRFLGGARTTRHALRRCVGPQPGQSLSLLDLGTGAADIPIAIVRWARARALDVRIDAVDFNPAICALARDNVAAYPEITIHEADVLALPFAPESFDYAHCAMFLHHFPQAEAAHIFRIMYRFCRKGFIVNDLHRHRMAFYAITCLARLLSRSPMFQHDAPVSVLRGFRRQDFAELARWSDIDNLTIKRLWPFRFMVIARK